MDPPRNTRDQPQEDNLSASTLHDLRGPLTIIRGQAQLLERSLRRNELPHSAATLTRLSTIDQMVVRLAAALEKLDKNHQRLTTDGNPDDDT